MSGTESNSSATTTSASSSSASTTPTTASNYRLPSDATLQHVSKLAIVEDKPIMLDYWTQSLEKKVLVGVRESGEKLLVKSAEEYTSAISKFYKSVGEYIVVTENSIYIVSSDIPSRRIS
jgi:hypothetical protein